MRRLRPAVGGTRSLALLEMTYPRKEVRMPFAFLKTIGLTDNEANLYELLLRLGEVPANQIIKESKLKRATAYKVLYALEEKKLISKKDVGKIIHFRPEPPTVLMNLAETQYKSLERARESLQAVVPELMSSYTLSVERPVVSTYEGVEGLKKIYEDTIKESKPICAVLQTAEVEPKIYEWLTKIYAKRRVKAGITARVIVASGKWSGEYQKKDEKELRESVLVPGEKFPFRHEIDIYGNKVAFINYKKGEKLIGVVIDNPQIATTMKAWFDLAWEGAVKIKS